MRDQSSLTITARHEGVWVAPEMKDYVGRWIPRGTRLGMLIDSKRFQFISVVRQEDAERLFGRELKKAEVRLYGEIGNVIHGGRIQIVPGGQGVLPTPALGWQGGGEIPVRQDDPSGVKSVEPFFEVHVDIPANAPAHLIHGRTGRIRFEQSPEPLLPRWIRALRQLVQTRYQI
jgi:putative peptide zinc metalloprotease protein